MAFELGSARHWARQWMLQKLRPGMTAVDATMGNGGDTEWLCESVGDEGMVCAFDVQPEAVERTSARLSEKGLRRRARLILAGHEHVLEHVKGPIDAAVFNLGWLPGGDKRVTTRAESTLRALDGCARLMAPGALLTVCAYPGHEEGSRESEAVLAWAKALPGARFQALITAYVNQPGNTPTLIAVHKIR